MKAVDAMLAQDNDKLAARRFADHVVHMLQDFIPEAAIRDARDLLARAAYEQKFELTSFAMRKEYEAWKSLHLETLQMTPIDHSVAAPS